jgi:hypothetical protein
VASLYLPPVNIHLIFDYDLIVLCTTGTRELKMDGSIAVDRNRGIVYVEAIKVLLLQGSVRISSVVPRQIQCLNALPDNPILAHVRGIGKLQKPYEENQFCVVLYIAVQL